MSQETILGIARQLLTGLPFIGRKTGREAVAHFIRDLRSLTEPVKFDVQDILASDARAVIVGELATRVKATDKVIESAFAIILTVSVGEIARFHSTSASGSVRIGESLLPSLPGRPAVSLGLPPGMRSFSRSTLERQPLRGSLR